MPSLVFTSTLHPSFVKEETGPGSSGDLSLTYLLCDPGQMCEPPHHQVGEIITFRVVVRIKKVFKPKGVK